MRTAKITIDGGEYVVEELRHRKSKAWRKKLEDNFTELATVLEGAPDTELTDGAALAGIVQTVSKKVFGSMDIALELVAEYAPDLPLDDAYDSEIMDAFTAILGLAYPFGSVLERVMSGVSSLNQRTLPN